METNFQKELEVLINKYSIENESDTPDFILAKYLIGCLENFSAVIKQREEWYGRQQQLTDWLGQPIDPPIDYDSQPIIDYDSTGNPPPNIIDTSRTGDAPDVTPSSTSFFNKGTYIVGRSMSPDMMPEPDFGDKLEDLPE